MEILTDLIDPILPLFRKLFWFVSGQFIAHKCAWCRVMFLASEGLIILVLVYFFMYRGPRPAR